MPNNNASINLVFSPFNVNNGQQQNNNPPPTPYSPATSLAFVVDSSGKKLDADGQVLLRPGLRLRIKRIAGNTSGITITINISCPDGLTYNPQSIVFIQTNGSGDDNGNSNFPQGQITCTNQKVVFTDTVASSNATNPPAWDFYIQIQKQASGNPLGWIHPAIENES